MPIGFLVVVAALTVCRISARAEGVSVECRIPSSATIVPSYWLQKWKAESKDSSLTKEVPVKDTTTHFVAVLNSRILTKLSSLCRTMGNTSDNMTYFNLIFKVEATASAISVFSVSIYELGTDLISIRPFYSESYLGLQSVNTQPRCRLLVNKQQPALASSVSRSSSKQSFILYEGWHAFAATVLREQGFPMYSVETVLRSNGNITLNDVYRPPYSAASAAAFYYQAIPEGGPYCIWRRGSGNTFPPSPHSIFAGEEDGVPPDCPNITQTLTRHAKVLVASGIDSVIVDATNICDNTTFGYVIELRPLQVIAEEWSKLREQGIQTPSITMWQCIPQGSTMWQAVLQTVYNDPIFGSLIATDPSSKKKIFFVPRAAPISETIKAQIEDNGGRNDVVVIEMWAQFPTTDFVNGRWAFFSPCVTGSGQYTDELSQLAQCNQYVTSNSPVGASITVSPSYQLGYSSVPFGAAGKVGEATLRMQFAKVLDSLNANISHLMISSFNEFISQPQPNPYPISDFIFSMGLENDPSRTSLWVDTYGCGISRDIEPTEECGSGVLETLQSCMRLLTLATSNFSVQEEVSLASLCSSIPDAALQEGSELCCGFSVSDLRTPVWSMRRTDGLDMLISNSPVEVETILKSGWGSEICTFQPGWQSTFCTDSEMQKNPLVVSGPFLISKRNDTQMYQPKNIQERNRRKNFEKSMIPLYRCRTPAGTHFFSTQPACEGTVAEYLIGFLAPERSTAFPRSLRRCFNSTTGVHFHSLDHPCMGGAEEALYGYVA